MSGTGMRFRATLRYATRVDSDKLPIRTIII